MLLQRGRSLTSGGPEDYKCFGASRQNGQERSRPAETSIFRGSGHKVCREGIQARFVLVGRLGGSSPGSISERRLEEWVSSGIVEWWGFIHDRTHLMPKSTIICLPSYREGSPKVLIGAAACVRL